MKLIEERNLPKAIAKIKHIKAMQDDERQVWIDDYIWYHFRKQGRKWICIASETYTQKQLLDWGLAKRIDQKQRVKI